MIVLLCSNKWGFPPLTLERYLQFWAMVCYSVTIWLLLFKREVKNFSITPLFLIS